jgi:hypothetical protein
MTMTTMMWSIYPTIRIGRRGFMPKLSHGENNNDAAGSPTKRTRRAFVRREKGKSMMEDIWKHPKRNRWRQMSKEDLH